MPAWNIIKHEWFFFFHKMFQNIEDMFLKKILKICLDIRVGWYSSIKIEKNKRILLNLRYCSLNVKFCLSVVWVAVLKNKEVVREPLKKKTYLVRYMSQTMQNNKTMVNCFCKWLKTKSELTNHDLCIFWMWEVFFFCFVHSVFISS